jgi:hypothetical protein
VLGVLDERERELATRARAVLIARVPERRADQALRFTMKTARGMLLRTRRGTTEVT